MENPAGDAYGDAFEFFGVFEKEHGGKAEQTARHGIGDTECVSEHHAGKQYAKN